MKQQQFKIEVEPKNKLVDNLYLSPIVDATRRLAEEFKRPYAEYAVNVKRYLLDRDTDFDFRFLNIFCGAIGSLGGTMFGLVSSATSGFGTFGVIATSLASAVGGLIAVPLLVVVGGSVIFGLGGLMLGGIDGLTKISRHHFAPKLLAAEKKAEAEQKARAKAVSIDTEHGIIRLIPTVNPANDFAASAEKPATTEQTVRVKHGVNARVVTTQVEGGTQVQVTFKS